MNQLASLIPVIIFFLAYKFSSHISQNHQPIIVATFFLVISTVIAIVYSLLAKKKQDKLTLYSNVAIVVFGSLTVFFHNPAFIKVKITIINFVFFGLLVYSYSQEKPALQKLFDGKITMNNSAWKKLSLRFAFLFLIIAIGNEVVYRCYEEKTWVNYKVFFVPVFSFVYLALQIRFMMKHSNHKI